MYYVPRASKGPTDDARLVGPSRPARGHLMLMMLALSSRLARGQLMLSLPGPQPATVQEQRSSSNGPTAVVQPYVNARRIVPKSGEATEKRGQRVSVRFSE